MTDFQSETTVRKLRTSAATPYYQTSPCQSTGALIRDNTVSPLEIYVLALACTFCDKFLNKTHYYNGTAINDLDLVWGAGRVEEIFNH